MIKRRGWSQFSPDEKLEALREDVNRALDIAERNAKKLEEIEENLQRIIAHINKRK